MASPDLIDPFSASSASETITSLQTEMPAAPLRRYVSALHKLILRPNYHHQ